MPGLEQKTKSDLSEAVTPRLSQALVGRVKSSENGEKKEREEKNMLKMEKATYSRVALNEGMKKAKAVRITAAKKDCYYPIFSDLSEVNRWIEDNCGNRHAFYCYQLEEYKDRLYNHYKETTAAEFAKLARRAKRAMMDNIDLILKDAKTGQLNIV